MTPQELGDLYGYPSERAAQKEITIFDNHCRAIIAASPFVIMATSGTDGLDLSPKGDPIGFVHVEDNKTLLIPDRPGNNRIDGLLNIASHPRIALLFIIPTVTETLRVNGLVEITADPEICDRFAIKGRSPKTVTKVTATQIFTHCGRAPVRAGLWNPDTWPDKRPVGTLYEMVRDHGQLPVDTTDQAAIEKLYKSELY